MPSLESLKIIIALLPGFLSQSIYQYFGKNLRGSDLDKLFSALAFTLINLLIATVICRLLKITLKKNDTIHPLFVIIITFVAISTGLGWTAIESKGILLKTGITTKFSRYNIWTSVFSINEEGNGTNKKEVNKWRSAFVKVGINGHKTYIGWPLYYSWEQEQNNSLFLKPAWVVNKDDTCTKINGPGVMLFQKDMKYIEFIHVPAEAKHPCNIRK